MNPVNIVGANGHRRANDFYPTPKDCVYALVDFLNIPKHCAILEPACGMGAIMEALRDKGYRNVSGSDIVFGVDFLERTDIGKAEWIITNPPFSIADKFIYKAHGLAVPFAYLLKIQYWNSAKRRTLFEQIRPRYVLPLTWRPDFTGQGNSLMDMMWCVWTPDQSKVTYYHPLKRGNCPECGKERE